MGIYRRIGDPPFLGPLFLQSGFSDAVFFTTCVDFVVVGILVVNLAADFSGDPPFVGPLFLQSGFSDAVFFTTCVDFVEKHDFQINNALGRSFSLTARSFFLTVGLSVAFGNLAWSFLFTFEIRFSLFCLQWKIGCSFLLTGSPRSGNSTWSFLLTVPPPSVKKTNCK